MQTGSCSWELVTLAARIPVLLAGMKSKLNQSFSYAKAQYSKTNRKGQEIEGIYSWEELGPHSSSKSVTENMYLAFSDWLVTLCLLPETLSPRDEDFEKRCWNCSLQWGSLQPVLEQGCLYGCSRKSQERTKIATPKLILLPPEVYYQKLFIN